ncbi:Six-hairpin glycosidase [Lophiostoma macrostomum CBS 122681]|uniref:Six-hairpin glycosidase n=1 Tax=Lophiostoma macrostomum CBS 122681 TaxID=1314788 RepID=A0A6A6SN83_9PLEO|nr:Six-hairpin glycosidase [Lophiostoma macrostomum CBS 122681]
MVSPQVISTVLAKAIEVATHSWEYGTVTEALLEWNNSSLSIWNNPFPSGQIPTLDVDDVQALEYVKSHIDTGSDTLANGDGAAGDPASLGIPALIIGQSNQAYSSAAARQADHLLNVVPRWSNGAISQREAYPEPWADFIYMAPPFLAYYAISTSDVELLKEAANQCKLYSDILQTDSGLWLHIVGSEDHTNDRALWSTGNAWAVAGMSRVLATMRKSGYNGETGDEQSTLIDLIKGIIDGARSQDVDNSGLLRNYLNDSSWFGEISGTSLIASAVFRMAVLEPEIFGGAYIDWAVRKMNVVDSKIDEGSGILSPAINPLDWHDRTPFTSGSPEGQSFVVLLHAAYRDWKGA